MQENQRKEEFKKFSKKKILKVYVGQVRRVASISTMLNFEDIPRGIPSVSLDWSVGVESVGGGQRLLVGKTSGNK